MFWYCMLQATEKNDYEKILMIPRAERNSRIFRFWWDSKGWGCKATILGYGWVSAAKAS